MRPFALVSAAAAPVLLIGGWTLAASRQPAGFDPVRDTISALAAVGATDRLVMTVALAGTGLAHVVTAVGLTGVRRAGRLVLAGGGVATALVAAFPLPVSGASTAHTVVATAAFVALALWPLCVADRSPSAPWVVRPAVTVPAGLVLLALVGWFGLVLGAGSVTGLAERVAAAAESLWPLVVAVSLIASRPGGAGHPRDDSPGARSPR